MPKRLPHLHKERTRHGTICWYVRVDRGPRIRVRGAYGSEEFMASYRAAVMGGPAIAPPDKPEADPRTLAWLIEQWMHSSDWGKNSAATRRQRENILLHVLEDAGSVPFRSIRKKHIFEGRERRKATPFAANNFLKTMRALFGWAAEANLIEDNPTIGVAFFKTKTEGHRTWSIEDVERFRKRWPLGTRERVAFELLLNTGLRRGDAVRLGRQHIRDGVASIKTEKTNVQLYIPILPSLQAAIDAGPVGEQTFICNTHGQRMPKESFGNWFRDACTAAGIEGSAHGIRKLAATTVAENGGSEKELQALFGWKSQHQSALYTREADSRRLALRAALKLAETG
jgi:integrase